MKRYIKTLCLGMMLMLSASAFAQNQTVTGTVVDELGEPVIGATVTVAGTKTATVTDLDGNYKISAPAGSKVVISYIGYLPMTVKPGGKVQLQEDKQNLQEVVVVGYGSQKKAHLTGAVVTVPMDEIRDIASGDLASTLRGLVPGLSVSDDGEARPGVRATMSIRGSGSLADIGSTAQEPLYVIDGYIYPNDVKVGNSYQNLGAEAFNNLDPNEVESISVLKDAAAAVYGSRAANGVILVTTKKGKLGAPQISYSGTFGFNDEVSRTKMLNAYDYGRLYNIMATANPTNTSLNKTIGLYQADELEAMKGLNYDLLDKYWETAITQKHGVNVSGATESASYFANLSYFTQDGNLGNLDYSRWNARVGVDVKISKWVSANMTLSGDYGKKNKPLVKIGSSNEENDYRQLLTRPRYIPEYVGDGYYLPNYGITNGRMKDEQYYNFSVLQNNQDFSRSMSQSMTINGSLKFDFGWWEPLKGLTASFTYAKSINTDKTNEFGSKFTLYQMRNRTGSGNHLYTAVGDNYADYLTPDNFMALEIANGGDAHGYLQRDMVRTDNYQINFTMNYARDFGKHHVNALFSIEKSEAESEFSRQAKQSPYSFTNFQSNTAIGERSGDFTRAESGSLSYIGRLNYAYADKYLFEFLLRSDASTKFSPDNYWGTFPSFSAGWIISEEEWFQKAVNWVDFLKVRASWGITGRDNTIPWQWLQHYGADAYRGPMFGTNMNGDTQARISISKTMSAVNADAHWDKSYKFNFGLDASVLNKRLSFNIDYWSERNREMLLSLTQDIEGIIGTQTAQTNYGEMNSWGIEIGATWRDKIGKDFKYSVNLNTGYSDNKILEMDWQTGDDQYKQYVYGSRTDFTSGWGMQCIGMFRSFQDIEEYFDTYLKKDDGTYGTYMGLTKDRVYPGMLIYKDVRGHKKEDGTYEGPDHEVSQLYDQVRLSNRSNPYSFTCNLNASWKGLSLTAQFNASWGGYSQVPTAALSPNNESKSIEYGSMPSFWNPDNVFVYKDIYDGSGNLIQKANPDAAYPNPGFDINRVESSFWRVNGTRIRLNRITLAYTLPTDWVKVIGLKNVRVNVTGLNLLSLYNPYPDKFIDPMCTYGKYPMLRKFTVGLNVSF